MTKVDELIGIQIQRKYRTAKKRDKDAYKNTISHLIFPE